MVLVGDRRAEERHEAIAEELIDGALVAVDLGEAQGEEPVQEGVHRLRAQTLGQRRGVGDVAEEHGHLLALPLDRAPQGEDLVSEVLRSVGLWARELRRRCGLAERRSALPTESVSRGIRGAAGCADGGQRGGTLPTESRPGGILVLAPGALHACYWLGRSRKAWAAATNASARANRCWPRRRGTRHLRDSPRQSAPRGLRAANVRTPRRTRPIARTRGQTPRSRLRASRRQVHARAAGPPPRRTWRSTPAIRRSRRCRRPEAAGPRSGFASPGTSAHRSRHSRDDPPLAARIDQERTLVALELLVAHGQRRDDDVVRV